jgi:tetratricopeptide (TPR) repeat protein
MPLTKVFASAELDMHAEFAKEAERRLIDYLKQLYSPSEGEYSWRYADYSFFEEGPNILEAIEWAYAHGDASDVFLLTQAAFDYLDATGEWSKLIVICARALSLARSIRDPIAIARFARLVGWIFRQWGRLDVAELRFSEALRQYQQMGNESEGEGIALLHLGAVYRKRGEFEKSREICDRALEIANTQGNGDLRAMVLTERGKLARDMGEWQLAWDTFAEVRDWFEKRAEETPRDEILARSNWGHLSSVAYHLGRYDEAKDLCLRSLEFFETQGTRSFLATLKYRLALAEEALGEFDLALENAREAADWFDRLGMKPDYAEAKVLLERLEHQQGE